jgi:N-acetylglucosaminyldiphosphoundecaprenol N-acetyl-beta-D-mannosaminyltransferase
MVRNKFFDRVDVMGLNVDLATKKEVIEVIDYIITQEKTRRNIIIAMNPRKIMSVQNNKAMIDFLNSARIIIADGIGLVQAVKLLYKKSIPRVTGFDVMQEICFLASQRGYKVFVLGATEEVNTCAVKNLKKRFPKIKIVGKQHGYFKKNEENSIINKINSSEAEILFLAMGSPKQEKFMQEVLSQLNVKICQGIGGTLDIISGKKKRAPKLFILLGLEGVYRVFSIKHKFFNGKIWKCHILFRMKILKQAIIKKNY